MIKIFCYKTSTGGGNSDEFENAINEFVTRSDIVAEEMEWYQSSAGASLHSGGAHIQHMLTCVVKYRGIP